MQFAVNPTTGAFCDSRSQQLANPDRFLRDQSNRQLDPGQDIGEAEPDNFEPPERLAWAQASLYSLAQQRKVLASHYPKWMASTDFCCERIRLVAIQRIEVRITNSRRQRAGSNRCYQSSSSEDDCYPRASHAVGSA